MMESMKKIVMLLSEESMNIFIVWVVYFSIIFVYILFHDSSAMTAYFKNLHGDTSIIIVAFFYAFSYGRRVGRQRGYGRNYFYMLFSVIIFFISILIYSQFIDYYGFNFSLTGQHNIDYAIFWTVAYLLFSHLRFILERMKLLR